jgi:glucose/arabinose dehydrogenase
MLAGTAAAAQPAERVAVTAVDLAFEPSVIEVPADAPVEVTFVNQGQQPHNIAFYLDEGGTPIGPGSVGPIISSGGSASVTFTAPGPGRYPFLCDVHPLQMQGTLRVRGAAATVDVAAEAIDRPTLPLAVHPRIHPGDFHVTTFAVGLPFVTAIQPLDDGSILVAANDPGANGRFLTATGKLLRLVDEDADGVADRIDPIGILREVAPGGPFVFADLPGAIVQMRRLDDLLVMTVARRERSTLVFLRAGETPIAPWTVLGSVDLRYPEEHLHDTYALAVRDGPDPESVEVYFNVGSRFNAQGDTTPVPVSGLIEGSLQPESIHRITVTDDGTNLTVSEVTLIAIGLRNAAGLAFHPSSGDLYLQDNGIDREDDPDDQLSADELNVIPADRLGRDVLDFGFPDEYVAYRSVPGTAATGASQGRAIGPIVAFRPIEGSEAEGAAELTFAPPLFPDGLDDGIFVGFHGRYTSGGLANEENPLLYVDLHERAAFELVPNDAPSVGHLDNVLATEDSLYIADLNPRGALSSPDAGGVIYQIRAASPGPSASATETPGSP